MCFKNLAWVHIFNCLLNFHWFFFAEDLGENLDEASSSWAISSFEDYDHEALSISESSDDASLSLSLSDSSNHEMYFLFLDLYLSF